MSAAKVILIGAGPGDPELITLKALRYLQQADVVLTDRLVGEELLREYVNPDAEIVFVGKESGSSKSVAQQQINDLLVKYAYQDKLVVRLKGGDVAFFSNVLDELLTLTKHNIPYEVVPGITAASGASAYAGIPLTARGYADSVRFLTCHSKVPKPDSYWQELAASPDTLVFYMSGNNMKAIVANLIAHNISDEKAIAVIEQATTPYQKVTVYQFSEYARLEKQPFSSPTLLIIGSVVNLYKDFAWTHNSKRTKNYFMPAFRQEKAERPELIIF